jgi:hypothetical protein
MEEPLRIVEEPPVLAQRSEPDNVPPLAGHSEPAGQERQGLFAPVRPHQESRVVGVTGSGEAEHPYRQPAYPGKRSSEWGQGHEPAGLVAHSEDDRRDPVGEAAPDMVLHLPGLEDRGARVFLDQSVPLFLKLQERALAGQLREGEGAGRCDASRRRTEVADHDATTCA